MKLTAIVKGPEQEGGGTGVRIKISSKLDSKSLKSENTSKQRDDLLGLSGVGTCNTLEQWCKSLNPLQPSEMQCRVTPYQQFAICKIRGIGYLQYKSNQILAFMSVLNKEGLKVLERQTQCGRVVLSLSLSVPYLIFVTSTTSGARVNFFRPV